MTNITWKTRECGTITDCTIQHNDIIDELDRYVEELGNLNLKLCGRGESA